MNPYFENTLVLPNLKVLEQRRWKGIWYFKCETLRRPMPCLRCASRCDQIYDQRCVRVRDQKIRNFHVELQIWKKRYFCPKCKKPRTETVDGVLPGRRTTQRFRRWVMQMCRSYSNLKAVQREARISNDFVYRAFYEQLDLEARKHHHPWPKAIGIDEHAFKRRPGYAGTSFATLLVDHRARRPIDLVEGKSTKEIEAQLVERHGRENVQWATLDLCDPFKNFIRGYFPNAKLVADPFHVLRLLTPALNQARKAITGDQRTLRVRRLILRSRKNLSYEEKWELDRFLERHPSLEELYEWKERLHELYRIKGASRAEETLLFMLDEMSSSSQEPIRKLRKTLQKWYREILNHFECGLTNARVEGFNNVAKTIKKQAYGFRSFKNYRLRVLTAGF